MLPRARWSSPQRPSAHRVWLPPPYQGRARGIPVNRRRTARLRRKQSSRELMDACSANARVCNRVSYRSLRSTTRVSATTRKLHTAVGPGWYSLDLQPMRGAKGTGGCGPHEPRPVWTVKLSFALACLRAIGSAAGDRSRMSCGSECPRALTMSRPIVIHTRPTPRD
jgi:hypothetical protein